MQTNQVSKKKAVARYMLMPGILPRIKDFSQSGFGWLAQLMAIIYYSVRLIPRGHPYLDPANKGRFGIRHVIAVAAHNLEFKRQNIDQIIVFFALILGFVLLMLQFALILGVFIIEPAFAGPPVFAGIFATPDSVGVGTSQDIAFMMMDSVFGIPGIFTTTNGGQISCVAAAAANACGPDFPALPAFPTPFQVALHALFNYYNLAILIIGVLIFCYYVVIMVAETAQTGTPFGKRFNHIWAPIRLVVALGLLVPINYGLNSAQYITLYAAKLGSGFATNAWHLFNNSLSNAVGTADRNLLAIPTIPDVGHIMQFMTIVSSCKYAYEKLYADEGYTIESYLVKEDNTFLDASATSYNNALQFFNNADIVIRYGYKDDNKFNKEKAHVAPLCGEITISTKSRDYPGAIQIQEQYYDWIRNDIWTKINGGPYFSFARRVACVYEIEEKDAAGNLPGYCNANNINPAVPDDDFRELPPDTWKQTITKDELNVITNAIQPILNQLQAGALGPSYTVEPELLNRGWAGAGIWYNRIAEWNGSLIGAVKSVPTPNKMPQIMEYVEKEVRMHNENVRPKDRFNPRLRSTTSVEFTDAKEEPIAVALGDVFKYWREYNTTAPVDTRPSNNILVDVINMIFGTDALFNIRRNEDVHPLAQLSALGKGIIDSSVRNLVVALPFAAVGGMAEALDSQTVAGVVNNGASAAVTFAGVGLGIGFMLYYILPFLPFIYFFFALSAWVKTIFEAMVGTPLWALAHLRVDGNGLPGDTALNGYFLIFEIFVRPILTVFGLLASVTIFGAMAKTFNEIFGLVIDNLSGFDCAACSTGYDFERKNGPLDEFFFTILYTIIIYIMATSSFKMIDQIPQSILRWMGGGVDSFGDTAGDPKEGLVQYAAFGGNSLMPQATRAMQQGAEAVGMAAGTPLSLARNLVSRQTTVSGAKN